MKKLISLFSGMALSLVLLQNTYAGYWQKETPFSGIKNNECQMWTDNFSTKTQLDVQKWNNYEYWHTKGIEYKKKNPGMSYGTMIETLFNEFEKTNGYSENPDSYGRHNTAERNTNFFNLITHEQRPGFDYSDFNGLKYNNIITSILKIRFDCAPELIRYKPQNLYKLSYVGRDGFERLTMVATKYSVMIIPTGFADGFNGFDRAKDPSYNREAFLPTGWTSPEYIKEGNYYKLFTPNGVVEGHVRHIMRLYFKWDGNFVKVQYNELSKSWKVFLEPIPPAG